VFPPLLTRSAERVARDGYRGLKEGRRMVVPGSANQVVTAFLPMLPHGLLLALSDLRKRRLR
jgi:short-subunit dehydrogenase